jgi:hypothetical protein
LELELPAIALVLFAPLFWLRVSGLLASTHIAIIIFVDQNFVV